jgi:hypothetical protein
MLPKIENKKKDNGCKGCPVKNYGYCRYINKET